MFAFIRGTIDYKGSDFAVIDAGGVGYRIFTSRISLESMSQVGEETKLYTYFNAKEDNVTLYGFCSKEELHVFELLISVNGVGPKAGISILSTHSYTKVSLAIASEDYKILKEAPGVGNKTAQRIVLELKDKVKNENLVSEEELASCPVPDGSIVSEAVAALCVLGYSEQDSAKLVAKTYKDGMDLEEVIKAALKQI